LNLSQLIDRLLAKKPADRHHNPAELIEDLNRVERGEVPLKLYKPKKSKKHNPLRNWLTVAAAVLIVASCFLGWNFHRSNNAVTIIKETISDAQQMAVKHDFDSAKELLDDIISEYAESNPKQVKKAETLRTKLIEQHGKWIANEANRKRQEQGVEITRAETVRRRKLHNCLRNAMRLKNQENHVTKAVLLVEKAYQLCNNDIERAKIAAVEKKVQAALIKMRPWAAVADFTLDKSVEAKLTGSAVAVKLEQALGRKYRLVTRNQVKKALRELRFQSSDLADKSKAKQFGKLVGAEYLISGSVIQLGREITVACQIFSIETGAIRQTAEVSAFNVNDFNYMIRDAAKILGMSNAEKIKYVKKLNSSKQTSGGKYPQRSQAPPSNKKDRIIPGLGIKLVYVTPGSFQMGANDGHKFERPKHKVTISKAYWIGKYEVTQKEYHSIMKTNPSQFKNANNPVEQVTWNNAVEFCKKINEQEKKARRLPRGYEYRLPTEAEWEFAARGGINSRGYQYSGSNDIDKVAWYYENSGDKKLYDYSWSATKLKSNNCRTHEVGKKVPNELGIHDMNGNVQEFCIDLYGSYTNSHATNPIGALSGSSRVYRSGSLGNYASRCRIVSRGSVSAKYKHNRMGFRLALAPCIADSKMNVPTSIEKTIPGLGIKLVHVAPGSFMMGSNTGKSNEKPVHKVTINNAYWIGKHEVTHGEYQAIIKDDLVHLKLGKKPANSPNWHDAVKFCQKLTAREKKAGRLPSGYEFRLPTEAEWEFAARGGNKSRGYKYSGSNNPDKVMWNSKNSGGNTYVVGSKLPNELGIYDMSGNVWEWCLDNWHDNYIGAPTNGSRWNGKSSAKILRGASCYDNSSEWNLSSRNSRSSRKSSNYVGFRIVLAPIITRAVADTKKDLSKTIPGLGLKLVHLEPGSFMIGYNDEAKSQPVHKVTIKKAYWIGKYEVTQKEYLSIMGTNPSHFNKGNNKPVEQVSWNDALEFCAKLTEQEKKAGRLPSGYEYRLPSESEWEYAARGGAKSKGYMYSGSGNINSVAWHVYNSGKKTHDVGQKMPNELGIHDMSGNVWEWCINDWYSNYNSAPAEGTYQINRTSISHANRGGSCRNNARSNHVSHRNQSATFRKVYNLGFRVALAPVIVMKPEIKNKIIPGLAMRLVYVAPGTFEMGASKGKSSEPVHDVTIYRGYWIGKYEVTQNEYQAIMKTNPSHFKGSNKPVEKVTWNNALKFCKNLTEREQKAGRLPSGYTYQLPTEAEWEYAARGGNKSKGYKYSGSNKLIDVAWYPSNSGKQTHEVGGKAANELGIHDMSGNVYEWCIDDWHNSYSNAPSAANRWGKGNTPLRIRRGGSWRRNFVHKVTLRSYCPPSRTYNYLGFRVVLRTYHEARNKINTLSISKFSSASETSVKTIIPQIKAPPRIEKKVYKKVSEEEHQESIKNEKRKARKRMYADMKKYSQKEYAEIQSLYQALNKPKDPEKTKKLIAKYPKANLTGCAVLYLAYKQRGNKQKFSLLKVIKKYGDCYYDDGVNVGACAKYFLARYYLSHKQMNNLKLILDDLRENHRTAISHNRKNLASLVEEML
jgi:formylglycine-generating enzyme required for sulfatase activity